MQFSSPIDVIHVSMVTEEADVDPSGGAVGNHAAISQKKQKAETEQFWAKITTTAV